MLTSNHKTRRFSLQNLVTREILLISIGILSLVGSHSLSYADDNWTGPYIGATVGANSTTAVIDNAANGNDLDIDDSGVSVGVVGGYNFAPFGKTGPGQWVLGVEGDLQNMNSDSSSSDSVVGKANLEGSWMASTRMRAGYAWDDYHLYGTAGIAFSDLHVETTTDKGDDFNAGIVLGLGGEMNVSDNWTGRIEGLVYGFGEEDRTISGSKHDVGYGASMLRIGIIRKF